MGAFDDLVSDLPRVSTGTFDDLTQGTQPAGTPLDPNSVRMNWGFGYESDIPIPETLRPLARGAVWADDNVMAPLARGVASFPGFIGDIANWGYDKAAGNETNFGEVTQGLQDTLGLEPRPYDAGFGTDVLEAIGGGLAGGGGLASGVVRGARAVPFMVREIPAAVGSVLGQYAGGDVGEYFGGDTGRVIGEILGSMGGGSVPDMASAGKNTVARQVFAKPNGASGQAFDDLTAAGITPRPGLVGNKQAARLENSAANFPVVGGVVNNRQHRTFEEFQRALYETSDQVGPRYRPGVERPMSPQTLGGDMRMAAGRGSDNLDAYFAQNYSDIYRNVPADTLVEPNNLSREVARQNNPFDGAESNATRAAIDDYLASEIAPEMRAVQGPTAPGAPLPGRMQGPAMGGEAAPQGVPIRQARAASTEAFYDAKAGGTRKSGATEQARKAWNRDIEEALMLDPQMAAAFPDPADRAAQVERLRVLNTEYAMANARDISRAGTSPVMDGRLYVGGDKPALDRIVKASTDDDAGVVPVASAPGNMAVLQRTAPDDYAQIAAEVIRNEAQLRNPFGNLNVSPQAFAGWWNNLDENSKLIFTNERSHGTTRSIDPYDPAMQAISAQPAPTMERFDTLGRVGELFRQAGAEANPSGTAPTLATMGLLTGLFTHPVKTVTGLASGGALSRMASSEEMARIIAGRGPSTEDLMIDALARGLGHVSAQQTAPDYAIEDANGNRYDINGNLVQ